MPKISTLIIAAITVAAIQLTTQAAHDSGESESQREVISTVHHQPHRQPMNRYYQAPSVVQQSSMRRIWIPGTYHAMWIPPKVEVQVDSAGQRRENIIRYGYYQYHWTPGRYELVPVVQQSYVYPNSQRSDRHVAMNYRVAGDQKTSQQQAPNRDVASNRNNQRSRQSVSRWSPATLY